MISANKLLPWQPVVESSVVLLWGNILTLSLAATNNGVTHDAWKFSQQKC